MIKKLTNAVSWQKPQVVVLAVILLVAVVLLNLNILTKNNNYNYDNKSSCLLTGNSCEVNLPAGILTVVMARLPTIEEQIPLTFRLPQGEMIDAAYIEGVNMFMGKIPVPLKHNENGEWTGWFMLGACSEPTMQWRMVITLKNRPEPVLVYFTTQM
ncbi:hypothetical protein [Alteromonas lipolytica]|uniref:YtkA-like domain-containing protein n=1 Tax=Alteromonas lipolytica TaxID=1856405 RepID=A0A1E8FGY6_9ALTE|nr:hypothetical protein [Alteromonas lipolytica]OFI35217.1 hypothetical protein BFC17_16890 [Alteromonas lipolytica]GGF57690.1 hypothetical protein GCM10011338_07440 [Alteromonas lipolytica]